MRISVDSALLGIVATLGICDGIRLLGVPLFVPEPLGAGFYLLMVSAMLLLALVVETVSHSPATLGAKPVRRTRVSTMFRNPVVQVWLGLILYTILLKFVGYFLSTLCFAVVSIRIFGEHRWARLIVYSSVLTLSLYIIFRKLAGISLP